MGRETLIRDMERRLLGSGYSVSAGSGCFDLLARRDSSLALKVLVNVDSFTRSEAGDMKALSYFLDTSPFLIGERANRYDLLENVVYERFGVAAMSPGTFSGFLEGVMPRLRARRGGFSAVIDRKVLEARMKERDLCASSLSSSAELSEKTVYKCRRGGCVDEETRVHIERVVGAGVDACLDPERLLRGGSFRKPRSAFKKVLYGHLERLGLLFSFLERSPFNLVIKEDRALISVASRDKKRMAANADVLRELERGMGLSPLFITAHGSEKSMEGIPVVSIRDVRAMRSGEEFMEQVEDRSEPA